MKRILAILVLLVTSLLIPNSANAATNAITTSSGCMFADDGTQTCTNYLHGIWTYPTIDGKPYGAVYPDHVEVWNRTGRCVEVTTIRLIRRDGSYVRFGGAGQQIASGANKTVATNTVVGDLPAPISWAVQLAACTRPGLNGSVRVFSSDGL